MLKILKKEEMAGVTCMRKCAKMLMLMPLSIELAMVAAATSTFCRGVVRVDLQAALLTVLFTLGPRGSRCIGHQTAVPFNYR